MATVSTTGLLFHSLTSGSRQRRALAVRDRSGCPLLRVPKHERELRVHHDVAASIEDSLGRGHARATDLAHRALDRHGLEGGVYLGPEVHGAPPDDVLVAPDAVLLQERVPPLLEIRQHDGVVDVAQPVEIAPPHLHPVAVGVAHRPTPPWRPSASRSGAKLRTRSIA